ncbi:MAG: hypothetical protein ABW352_20070 [Polyangiales bacterium]
MKRVLALLSLLACGDDAPTDLADASVEDDGFMGCPADVPQLALNNEARGKTITASVVAASRVPARRYLNDWTFAFRDAAGNALNDVTIATARTWMPVHGHDGLVMPQLLGAQVRRLNFNMRGPWEVQLSLRSASAGTDDVVFHVCIAE